MQTKPKTTSLSQLKDKYIGKEGSEKREKYELKLKLDLIGETILNQAVLIDNRYKN